MANIWSKQERNEKEENSKALEGDCGIAGAEAK